MSTFINNKAAAFGPFDYQQTTRPPQRPEYDEDDEDEDEDEGDAATAGTGAATGFVAHPPQTHSYTAAHAQVPSDMAHSTGDYAEIATAHAHAQVQTQSAATHEPAYYVQADVDFPAYLDAGPRPLPQVVSYMPKQGRHGNKLTVYLTSAYDLLQPPVNPVVAFGQARRQSSMQRTMLTGQMYQYALTADVPSLAETGSPSPQVSLQLHFEDSPVVWDATELDFGQFTYLDDPGYLALQAPHLGGGKKRKLSPEASPRRSPVKRAAVHSSGSPFSNDSLGLSTPFSPSVKRSSLSEQFSQSRRYSQPEYLHAGSMGISNLPAAQQYYTNIGQPTSLLPQTTSPPWPYFPNLTAPGTTRSPSVATLSSSSKASHVVQPTSTAANPPLFRTSTLQTPPALPNPNGEPNFNPYSIYPTKAQLKLEGDLESMAKGWSDAEWSAGRRLVQFRRNQSGNVISASFEAVTPEQREPNSICISCIWWEGKSECYVTSVDTISLLESLVAARFTVEEKNRIRRNLEGYRPTTVSKSKQGSEDFFRLVMSFPNPKPRNIEKDVKVFPWRILPRALTKIIGKYSASYASTASALPITASPVGPAVGGPMHAAIQRHRIGVGMGPSLPPPMSISMSLGMPPSTAPTLPQSLLFPTTTQVDPFSSHVLEPIGLDTTSGLSSAVATTAAMAQTSSSLSTSSQGVYPTTSWQLPSQAFTTALRNGETGVSSPWTLPGAPAPMHFQQPQQQQQQQQQARRHSVAGGGSATHTPTGYIGGQQHYQ